MTYLAAAVCYFMDEYTAFVCFSNLVLSPFLVQFYTFNETQISHYILIFNNFLSITLPDLYNYFQEISVNTDSFLISWILTLFLKPFPLHTAVHLIDVLICTVQPLSSSHLLFNAGVFEFGHMFLKISLSILSLLASDHLINQPQEMVMKTLHKLPDNIVLEAKTIIENMHKFNITLSSYINLYKSTSPLIRLRNGSSYKTTQLEKHPVCNQEPHSNWDKLFSEIESADSEDFACFTLTSATSSHPSPPFNNVKHPERQVYNGRTESLDQTGQNLFLRESWATCFCISPESDENGFEMETQMPLPARATSHCEDPQARTRPLSTARSVTSGACHDDSSPNKISPSHSRGTRNSQSGEGGSGDTLGKNSRSRVHPSSPGIEMRVR